MQKIIIFSLGFFISFQLFSQQYDPGIDSLINEVNIDSLEMYVRQLSGEDSVMINGQMELIEHRISNWGNDLAAEYLIQTLGSFGLESIDQVYSNSGRNILAIQEGTLYPDQYYIICAHYDAVDYYCADDNASGSAGVLEASRILSQHQFEYSIVYGLWDEEEIGLVGSAHYALQASNNEMDILSVINMDMIAWDNDGDMVAEIHSNNEANSLELSDYMLAIDNIYGLAVNPEIQNPGTWASDHSRFWTYDYAAILLIEEYFGGDFNPYYHTENDRISEFNMDYFHQMAKLSIGSLASFAAPIDLGTGTESTAQTANLVVYPNPASGYAMIELNILENTSVSLNLYDHQGILVKEIVDQEVSSGKLQYSLPIENLSSGLYLLVLSTNNKTENFKIVVK